MELLEGTDSDMKIEEQTVGAVVAANYRAAEVFAKYGIDYCCGGNKPLGQVCAAKGISLSDLLGEIALATANGQTINEYNQWPLGFLADYIVNQHHAYAKKWIPGINTMAEAVVAAHGEDHPEVHTIERIWQALSGELIMHMQKEELMLFPHIKRMVRSQEDSSPVPTPRFGSVAKMVQTMEAEHESTGDQLAELEKLTNRFTAPEDACNTFQALYAYLDEFQKETKEHVHLENNILFPKAIVLETALGKQ